MSEITDKTKLKEDLVMPVPNLQNRMGVHPNIPKDSPFNKSINNAVRMMHKQAGIRKGRQTV